MRSRLKITVAMMALLLFSSACTPEPVEAIDETRIVATSLEVALILDMLEVEDIVGIVTNDASQLPERYQDVDIVDPSEDFDIAAIESLEPTLVLGLHTTEDEQASMLVEKQIDSAFINITTITSVMQSINELGTLLNKEEQANQIVDDFKQFNRSYREDVIENEGPTVLILVGDEDNYQIASENSYIGNVVKLAGGINVFGDAYSDTFLTVSEEEIEQQNPMTILRMPTSNTSVTMFDELFSASEMWGNLNAVSDEKVYDLEYITFMANMDYEEIMHMLKKIFYSE